MTVKVKAYGKLNLYLDITSTLENGYHSLDNLTQSVDIADIVTVSAEKSEEFSCEITCNDTTLPTDESNIAYKAARLFCEYTGIIYSCKIHIEKNIPIMGGMGGSSVDGGAVLCALNNISGYAIEKNELLLLSEKIGADTPLCIMGGTLVSDYGKMPERIKAKDDNTVFLCIKPGFKLSTKEAYQLYDKSPVKPYNKLSALVSLIERDGILSAVGNFYNSFMVLYNDERIYKICRQLINAGGVDSLMTGSGSVIYGIFNDYKAAENARAVLEYDSFICRPCGYGIELFSAKEEFI